MTKDKKSEPGRLLSVQDQRPREDPMWKEVKTWLLGIYDDNVICDMHLIIFFIAMLILIVNSIQGRHIHYWSTPTRRLNTRTNWPHWRINNLSTRGNIFNIRRRDCHIFRPTNNKLDVMTYQSNANEIFIFSFCWFHLLGGRVLWGILEKGNREISLVHICWFFSFKILE